MKSKFAFGHMLAIITDMIKRKFTFYYKLIKRDNHGKQ